MSTENEKDGVKKDQDLLSDTIDEDETEVLNSPEIKAMSRRLQRKIIRDLQLEPVSFENGLDETIFTIHSLLEDEGQQYVVVSIHGSAAHVGKTTFVGAARGLIERGELQDEADRNVVNAAAAFVENPSENLVDVMKQSELVGQVVSGYEMQGAEAPTEVDAVYAHLLALQCIGKISFIETELEQNLDPSSAVVQQAMIVVLDWAKVLAKAYKDTTILDAVNALQEEMKSL